MLLRPLPAVLAAVAVASSCAPTAVAATAKNTAHRASVAACPSTVRTASKARAHAAKASVKKAKAACLKPSIGSAVRYTSTTVPASTAPNTPAGTTTPAAAKPAAPAITPTTSTPTSPATTTAITTTTTASTPTTPTTPATPATPTPPAGGLHVGIVANTSGYGGASLAPRMAKVAADTGVRWMREEIDWSTVEPQRGVWDWSHYDTLFTDAALQHIQILPMLMSVPAWAGATNTTVPADPTDFATFVSHVVARYGPHGSFWTGNLSGTTYAAQTFEIWNEPFFPEYSAGDYNPARFALMMKAATIAGRAADPSAKFLMPVNEASGHVNGSSAWTDWIPGLYAAVPDLNNYFDGVAVHPYGLDLNDRKYGFAQIDAIHDDLSARGAGEKKEWITEVGYSTCGGGDQCVSETQQAADMTSDIAKVSTTASSYIAGIFFYQYADLGTADPNDKEQCFGLTHIDGTAKPGLAVLKAAALANPS